MEAQPFTDSPDRNDDERTTGSHTMVHVLWAFTDKRGKSTVCRVIQQPATGTLRMRLDYDGIQILAETHPDIESIEERANVYRSRALAEGWTEIKNGTLG